MMMMIFFFAHTTLSVTGGLTNYLIANLIADVQRLERGLQLLHIMCAVRDEEFTENAVESHAWVEVQPTPALSSSFAAVRSKLDNLPSHARASALRAPTLCFVDELHVCSSMSRFRNDACIAPGRSCTKMPLCDSVSLRSPLFL